MSCSSRERERGHSDAGDERPVKRAKTDETPQITPSNSDLGPKIRLPPSHILLGIPQPSSDGFVSRTLERDVGISEYVGRDVPSINGIIKQRFTDFLVNEVDLDGQVVHIRSLDMPTSEKTAKTLETEEQTVLASGDIHTKSEGPGPQTVAEIIATGDQTISVVMDHTTASRCTLQSNNGQASSSTDTTAGHDLWPERFTTTLAAFLSHPIIEQVKLMYLEGPEPPRLSDNGWAGRATRMTGESQNADTPATTTPDREFDRPRREKKGRRGESNHAGRDRQDHRKVLSEPIASKSTRTALHRAIRDLFAGKLESETDNSTPAPEQGPRIAITWAGRGGGRRTQSDRGARRAPRGTFPPYIHFTMQKTNRDTQDALGYLSRILHVNVKDLSVAGTKDKRAVTVQRVSLKRGGKTVEDVWKLANGQNARKSVHDILTQRGERGVRIADLRYQNSTLELGMLKGNSFVITLRNVQADSKEALDNALESLKHKGFINYYGMQRFGTASVPTHVVGLALMRSDWHEAVSLILQTRAGEHPDVTAAREAWLIHEDLDKALELMPRRAVAERCILESYKKQGGETRNAMGALSTIPKNLRLMYVHAYQSYVWNSIVSERIRMYGADKPVPGDLVYDLTMAQDATLTCDISDIEMDAEEQGSLAGGAKEEAKSKKPWMAPRVKTLTKDDVDQHTIFDVIMPLPGKDVAYPEGPLGEKYREFLQLDGLDPDSFTRKQKEYSLSGSYRAIIHRPKELEWSILRYTDPNVPLAQSDEDKLLGFDTPAVVEDGKFMAVQISVNLGTAAYATMALREITKTETSSHFQSSLTYSSEDQKFRGSAAGVD